MRFNKILTIAAAAILMAGAACGDDNSNDQNNGGSGGTAGQGGSGGTGGTGGTGGIGGTGGGNVEVTPVNVDGNITSDTTWTADHTYTLKKQIFVKNGATLTIEPGVTIHGEFGTALIVTRGAKVMAEGTAEAPIVFTSSKAPGQRAPADWGGVILLGKAPINVSGGENAIEGFPASQGDDIKYGGTDANDSSGTLKFVRIEFAGWEYAPDEEINSLTLGGVGRGTTLEYIQTHMGADDGIEFFGGTAQAKHLVVTRPDDDGIDWDLGFQGKIQFAVVQQEELVGNCGYEADNDGNNMDGEPRSNPTLSNITLIGSGAAPGTAGKEQIGMVLREGTAGKMLNHIVLDFADFASDVRDMPTVNQLNAGNLSIKNSIFFGSNGGNDWVNTAIDKADKDGGLDEGSVIGGDSTNRNVDPQLTDAHSLTAPNFLPKAGSPVLTGGATPPNDGFFDTTATFVGAFGTENWASGWTAFPEN